MLGVVLCVRCSCVGVFLFFASGALREVTLSRAPPRRPVCPVPNRSNSSHRPDVCLHPCVHLGDPESCSPRQADLFSHHELGTLAADLSSRCPCSSSLVWCQAPDKRTFQHSTGSSKIIPPHSQAACYGIEIAVLATGFCRRVYNWSSRGVSSSVRLVHSLRQGPPFNGCIM